MVHRDEKSEVPVMAVLWMDRDRRHFISTASTVLEGTSYTRLRWRQTDDGLERVELVVPQPQVVEQYYSTCAQIDRHNTCR